MLNAMWIPFDEIALKHLPPSGDYGFVYLFKLRDTDEILYIGSTKNLCQRFFNNHIGGAGGETTKRIHNLLITQGYITKVDVAWKECFEHIIEEKRLRKSYFESNGKLPSWNRQL
ncbi:MAG: GIY-YIG nuclease family protein [Dehalococcoidales bacterium]|nr:GIY-YIG nuclease family protein [Dehalococcoidales bacterium]